MKSQRNLIYIFSVIGVVSIVGYVAPLDPVLWLSSDQANDILLSIFGGAFIGFIVAYLEYKDRLYDLDQQFHPHLQRFLHLLCALETLKYSEEQKNISIHYFEEKESNEFRQTNSAFSFLSQSHNYKERLITLLGIPEDGLIDFESSLKEKLIEISKRYIDLREFDISVLVRMSCEYKYLIFQFSKQRSIDKLVKFACSYYQAICNHSKFGQFVLFSKQCDDSSMSETLIAERDVSSLWHDYQSSGCKENRYAYIFFDMYKEVVGGSTWLERHQVPTEPFWETRHL